MSDSKEIFAEPRAIFKHSAKGDGYYRAREVVMAFFRRSAPEDGLDWLYSVRPDLVTTRGAVDDPDSVRVLRSLLRDEVRAALDPDDQQNSVRRLASTGEWTQSRREARIAVLAALIQHKVRQRMVDVAEARQ